MFVFPLWHVTQTGRTTGMDRAFVSLTTIDWVTMACQFVLSLYVANEVGLCFGLAAETAVAIYHVQVSLSIGLIGVVSKLAILLHRVYTCGVVYRTIRSICCGGHLSLTFVW